MVSFSEEAAVYDDSKQRNDERMTGLCDCDTGIVALAAIRGQVFCQLSVVKFFPRTMQRFALYNYCLLQAAMPRLVKARHVQKREMLYNRLMVDEELA